jgi:inosine-uridine nucleoside N-ribohydrolase
MDCDTGADDAVAICMAAASPECELVGVTTCQGNTPVHNVVENCLRTLGSADAAQVPVVQGAAVALDGTYMDPQTWQRVALPPQISPAAGKTPADAAVAAAAGGYDPDEQSKLLRLPPAHGLARWGGEAEAARWLVRTIHATPGVSLCATGPLTNIALALR